MILNLIQFLLLQYKWIKRDDSFQFEGLQKEHLDVLFENIKEKAALLKMWSGFRKTGKNGRVKRKYSDKVCVSSIEPIFALLIFFLLVQHQTILIISEVVLQLIGLTKKSAMSPVNPFNCNAPH